MASASPGNLLEMHVLRIDCRPTEPEPGAVVHEDPQLCEPCGASDTHSGLRTAALKSCLPPGSPGTPLL